MTQFYLVIRPKVKWEDYSTRIEACLSAIKQWMGINMLKLNTDKTEFKFFSPKGKINPDDYQLNNTVRKKYG